MDLPVIHNHHLAAVFLLRRLQLLLFIHTTPSTVSSHLTAITSDIPRVGLVSHRSWPPTHSVGHRQHGEFETTFHTFATTQRLLSRSFQDKRSRDHDPLFSNHYDQRIPRKVSLTRRTSDRLLPQRASDLTCEESRIRFTPVKAARSAPRVWDRKPSTSFLARSKSRKVWKRFRTSFNSLKMLQQMVAAEDAVDDEPQLEINGARNTEYLRGVKRRFLLLENPDQDRNSTEQTQGRSFLETKWESEATGRKRIELSLPQALLINPLRGS